MEEIKEFKNSVFDTNNNGFISIPYSNYVANSNIDGNRTLLDNLRCGNYDIPVYVRALDISTVRIVQKNFSNGFESIESETYFWTVISLKNGHIIASFYKNVQEAYNCMKNFMSFNDE